MKALVTGFDPFGGEVVNPSLEAVRRLPARIGELIVVTQRLPAAFAASLPELYAAIEREDPDIVLCTGEAGSRTELSPERVAINVQDARIPDNEGAQPVDVKVAEDGPAAYFTTLPIKAAVLAMRQAGLPVAVSNSAGTFVCNHVFYGLMHYAATRKARFRGGFMHVPYLPEQAANHPKAPSMAVETIARGIEILLAVAAERSTDLVVAEGAVS
ncbi:pyroglutamyl-peptidase I [Limobrevibacterium gyesilva]|uniref:Pyrrolidone-carboxylate peptidase n=1 Tax=Limobrevibacterium gyesilva TaxID=2991712 RepID=A0AA42CJ27_9PROT|nr:pyroglutamyl-peptidase I [Limobrevibacterium gyesilva]MCW3476522.1 pyroglutamyl-peptidase I [Limobrevibacterium gyesilva]